MLDPSREGLDQLIEFLEDRERELGFGLPTPGRERLYGRFDGVPPQASTQRNLANRRRVIE